MALYKHRVEQQLREREHRLATILRSIGDGVLTCDDAGLVTYLNPVAEVLTGWLSSDARGRPVAEVVGLYSQAGHAIACPTDAVVAGEAPVALPEEVVLVTRQGGTFPVSATAAAIVDDGTVLGAVMVFRDVSERKVLRRQMEFADQLVTLGSLAAGVAHEVNNPLQALVLNLGLAGAQLADLEAVEPAQAHPAISGLRQALDECQQVTQTITAIIAELESLARTHAPSSGSSHVTTAVDTALRLVPKGLRNLATIVREDTATAAVAISETKLTQVILNLVVNAVHAMDAHRPGGNQIRIATRTLEDEVEVEVVDTGRGMDSETLEHAREPFFTTKEVGRGTGLGLAVCHGIVTACGGSLTLESTPGVGTRVVLRLPVVHEASEAH
jgi:PAS domain S-box-containing protein